MEVRAQIVAPLGLAMLNGTRQLVGNLILYKMNVVLSDLLEI